MKGSVGEPHSDQRDRTFNENVRLTIRFAVIASGQPSTTSTSDVVLRAPQGQAAALTLALRSGS